MISISNTSNNTPCRKAGNQLKMKNLSVKRSLGSIPSKMFKLTSKAAALAVVGVLCFAGTAFAAQAGNYENGLPTRNNKGSNMTPMMKDDNEWLTHMFANMGKMMDPIKSQEDHLLAELKELLYDNGVLKPGLCPRGSLCQFNIAREGFKKIQGRERLVSDIVRPVL